MADVENDDDSQLGTESEEEDDDGMTDKLDFLEGDKKSPAGAKQKNPKADAAKKGPNAKRKSKDDRFGFGGKKSGKKWNTKESHDDVSRFRSGVAHGKGGKKANKGKQNPCIMYGLDEGIWMKKGT
ncbi:hypothetical protein CRUP_020085 [Coryphaenoides rupestris]|nr:hypothetical protein CRUP_020085 [Coryphaenoides rupestris]